MGIYIYICNIYICNIYIYIHIYIYHQQHDTAEGFV